MRHSKGIEIGAVFAVLLIAAFALVPMVSAESDMSAKVIEMSGTKTTFSVGSGELYFTPPQLALFQTSETVM